MIKSDELYIGRSYESGKISKKASPYSRVTILTGEKDDNDEDIYFTAGDDTGLELEVSSPYGTQKAADELLEQIKGFRYRPYDITNALLDPAAEIGDGITAGSIYGGLFSRNHDFNYLFTSDIGAAKNGEEDEEYKYEPSSNKIFERNISSLKSSLKIQQGLIEAKITFEEAESLISQSIDSLTLSVSNGGDTSTLTLKAGETTLSSEKIVISGFVEFWDLSHAGSTTINGANITTGTISADRIATNISQVNQYLTLGTSGNSSKIIFPPASAGGYQAEMSHTQYGVTLKSYMGNYFDAQYGTYIDSGMGLVLNNSYSNAANVIWGTRKPETAFAANGITPEKGQIYFKIDS